MHLIAALCVVLVVGCGGGNRSSDDQRPTPERVAPEDRPPAPSVPPMTDAPSVREFTATPAEAKPVTMTVKPLRAGDKTTETLEYSLHTVLQAIGAASSKNISNEETRDVVAHLEVTEADAEGPTKATLTYERRADQTLQNGKPVQRIVPAAENKPYTLVHGDKGTTLTYADGGDVPRRESLKVLDANYFFHRSGRFTALLPTGKLEPGHEVELDESQVAALLEQRPRRGQDVEEATLTYRGIGKERDRDVAVFRLDATVTRVDGILTYTTTLRGDVLVDPSTGRLVRATLQGPVSVVGDPGAHGGVQMQGKGAIALDVTETFTPAK